MTYLAACIVDCASRHFCDVTFAVESYAWLSTVHLKIPMTLSQKLASRYAGPLKIIELIL